MRRRTGILAAILSLGVFDLPVQAQGCAMCLVSAMSQGIRAAEALNLGILILLIPSFLIIASVLSFTFLRRFH